VKASTDTTLLSILPERFLSREALQNIQLIVRLPKTETSDAVHTTTGTATASTATAATTANNAQTVEVRSRSYGNSDVLEYSATVQQAIDTLKQLQHIHVSSSTTAQNTLHIEVRITPLCRWYTVNTMCAISLRCTR
jgi:hypothetical protein